MKPQCPKCNRVFRDRGRLRNHLESKRSCDRDRNKYCDDCQKDFQSVTHYRRHVTSVHSSQSTVSESSKAESSTEADTTSSGSCGPTQPAINRTSAIPVRSDEQFASEAQTTVATSICASSSIKADSVIVNTESFVINNNFAAAAKPEQLKVEDTDNSKVERDFGETSEDTEKIDVSEYVKVNANYIYLMREREYIALDLPIYKLGRTFQLPHKRFATYPKDSELMMCLKTIDCKTDESQLKNIFQANFIQRKDIGVEYFEGDYMTMIMLMSEYFYGRFAAASAQRRLRLQSSVA